MKHTTLARRISRRLAATCFALLLFGPVAARAAECPASSPADPQERRRLAKEWFGMAETAENGGNDAEATRSYACSYKMVAHPFTAYNLGRVSERSGDNELALKMFKAYLTLKPDAQDKEDVKNRVKALEEKIASGTALVSPETANSEEGADKTPAPSQEELAPPPEPKPAQVVRKPVEPAPEPETPSHAVEWIVGGATAAALVVGVSLNLFARSKMSACQADASKDPAKLATANDECNAARPLAYASYALISVAAVGAAVDAVLIVLKHKSGESSSGDDSSVGFMLLPGGGGGLTARGRF